MKIRRFICVLLAGTGASLTWAEEPASAQPATESSPVVKAPGPSKASDTGAPAAPAPRASLANKTPRTRSVSDEISASILAGLPRTPPPAKKPDVKPDGTATAAADTDTPQNGIIRLPEHIVRERRPAVLQEQAVSTKAGLRDIAMSRYISDADRALNRFNIFGSRSLNGDSTTTRALAAYAEDERLKNLSDLNDTARDISKTDAAAGSYIKRLSRDTYMRSSDFGWNGGSSHADRGMGDAATVPK